MSDANEWLGRTGESWAAHWRRTDRSFGPLTDHLIARSRALSFTSVLDIGCGAGELSLAIARSHPRAQVTGVDISPALIAAARERAANHANITFELADAAHWSPAAQVPDLLVSRHGVMFFEHPPGAFAHLASVAAPGAHLLFSCFRDRAENPFYTEPGKLLQGEASPADPRAPGPFAFADRAWVSELLHSAGWREATFGPYDFAMIAGAGADPVGEAVQYFSVIGPVARALSVIDGDARVRFLERLRQLAERHHRDGLVTLRAAAWVVAARRS